MKYIYKTSLSQNHNGKQNNLLMVCIKCMRPLDLLMICIKYNRSDLSPIFLECVKRQGSVNMTARCADSVTV